MTLPNKITISTTIVLTLFLSVNQVQLNTLHERMHPEMGQEAKAAALPTTTAAPTPTPATTNTLSPSDPRVQQAIAAVLPRGIPSVQGSKGPIVYGTELAISYDAAAQTINVLAPLEQDTRQEKLTGDLLARYIKIGMSASCEFCCGATAMVFEDGSKACGCAHSAAMRGLAAYLLTTYGDQLTDEQILTEVNKLKATYFPRQSVEKVLAASSGGSIDPSALNQLSPQEGGC